jgi:hypothetical protein
MERLVDRFLRDEILALQPIQANQHLCQTGKSVETVLYQLVVGLIRLSISRRLP